MRGSLAIRHPKCLTSRYVYVSWSRPAGDQVASGGHLPDPRSGCRLEEADRGFPGAAGGVTEPDRLPLGPTRPSTPPGPSPGGSLLQRPTPRPSQTARTQTRPGTVLVPRSSRPRLGHRASRGGWSDGAGLSLVRSAVGGGRCRVGLDHRDPTPPATDRAVLSGPCVSVPVVRPAGARLPSRLGPRSVWGHRPSGGSAGDGDRSRVALWGGDSSPQGADGAPDPDRDRTDRVGHRPGRPTACRPRSGAGVIGTCGSRSRPLRWSTPTTPG